MDQLTRPRRPYNSPLRQQRAAQTRERIVAAGAEILRAFPIWNWRAVTIPAVATHAGVSERTVYRHFGSERELRDAVMDRMGEEAQIDLEKLRLEDLREVTARIFHYVSSFPIERHEVVEPTLAVSQDRHRRALKTALEPYTTGWDEAERMLAAAMLDTMWNYSSYTRLVLDWDLEPKDAIKGISWLMSLAVEAIAQDRRP